MEETFETRDRKRPLKVYVTPTERQAIERQASVHRGWQPVDASATLKGKCPCGPRFASLSGVVRVPLPVIRSLCAWGLVLSLSASAPLAVLSADTPTEGGESPVLHSTIIQTERNRPQSPTVNTGDVRVVAPGTALDLVLSTEIAAGETVEGDEFFGKISKDVLVDGRVVIPYGTRGARGAEHPGRAEARWPQWLHQHAL